MDYTSTAPHLKNGKAVYLKSPEEEEEDAGKEDKMLSRVAFRAGEIIMWMRIIGKIVY